MSMFALCCILFSCFAANFCLQDSFSGYLHRPKYLGLPIGSFDSKMKRNYDSVDSVGPAARFQDTPFTALIVAGGVNNSIFHLCTGTILNTRTSNLTTEFNLKSSFILTTTFCLLDRKDPDASTKNLVYKVLIPDPNGVLNLAGGNWTAFNLTSRLFNPNVNTIKNYSVNVTIPPGNAQIQNISVNVNDIGLIQLATFIDIPGVQATVLKRPANFQPGNPVVTLGYGSPNFFQLHKTDRTRLIFALDLQNEQLSRDMMFFHDDITDSASTTPSTPIQAIESGDEGGPILNAQNEQIGITQSTWRVSLDNATVITFASIGLSTDFYYPYITGVLNLTSSNVTTSQPPPPVDVQSAATFSFPSFILCVVGLILSSVI